LIKKILVPVDGSENAQKALDFTLDLAEKYDSEVELFNVVEPVTVPVAPYTYDVHGGGGVGSATVIPTWVSDYTTNFKASHEKMLQDTLEKVKKDKPDLKISKKIVDGRPGTEITKRAKEGDFDLVVMGSRGLSGLKELVLGSVSDKVSDDAECPVLIVK
jgi:nucleotide-binding universal stress UspA family protein